MLEPVGVAGLQHRFADPFSQSRGLTRSAAASGAMPLDAWKTEERRASTAPTSARRSTSGLKYGFADPFIRSPVVQRPATSEAVRLDERQHEDLLKSASQIEAREGDREPEYGNQILTQTLRRRVHVPIEKDVEVPIITKKVEPQMETTVVKGSRVIPRKLVKDVTETSLETKEEVVHGFRERWVKVKEPTTEIIKKQVPVQRVRKLSYIDYEEEVVEETVQVPKETVKEVEGVRVDNYIGTRILELEEDIQYEIRPVFVKMGERRVRETGEITLHGTMVHGVEEIVKSTEYNTGGTPRLTPGGTPRLAPGGTPRLYRSGTELSSVDTLNTRWERGSETERRRREDGSGTNFSSLDWHNRFTSSGDSMATGNKANASLATPRGLGSAASAKTITPRPKHPVQEPCTSVYYAPTRSSLENRPVLSGSSFMPTPARYRPLSTPPPRLLVPSRSVASYASGMF